MALATANAFISYFFQNDSEDEVSDEEDVIIPTLMSSLRDEHEKVQSYAELTVHSYLPDVFRGFFKMHRSTFEVLCQHLAQSPEFAVRIHPGGREQLPLDKKIMIAIRYFASQETVSAIADRFGVTVDSVMKARRHTVGGLLSLATKFLKWPSHQEKAQLAQEFEQKGLHSFPGIIGAIDGTHIPIDAPADNPNAYFNRKKFHSVILQGVCTPDMKFVDVYSGWPGRVHDAKVLRHSDLWENGLEKCEFGQYHLIGDAAYPVRRWLMTPFRDTGNLTQRQRHFNTSLSSKRQCVERAFGLLKGRFRRLKHISIQSIAEVNELIVAICVLHNICIVEHDIDDYLAPDDVGNNPPQPRLLIVENEGEGFVKRNIICNRL